MKEAQLRNWLKGVFPEGLKWIEPGFGGTTGLPDVMIPLDGGAELPVELKVWERDRRGEPKVDIRPVQVRYHATEARRGRRTAFLVGLEKGSKMDIIAIPGHRAQSLVLTGVVQYALVAVGQTEKPYPIDDVRGGFWRSALISALIDPEFWRGGLIEKR